MSQEDVERIRIIAMIPIEAVLLLLHVAVFVFISTKLHRKDPIFASSFYKFYWMHSNANYGHLLMTIFNDVSIYNLWPGCQPCDMIYQVLFEYTSYVQLTTYTAIACNRFTAIVVPLSHERTWKGRNFYLTVLAVLLVPIPLSFVRVGNTLVSMFVFNVQYDMAWRQAGRPRSMVNSFINVITLVVDAVLEFWTWVAYYRLDHFTKMKHSENYRLLGKCI